MTNNTKKILNTLVQLDTTIVFKDEHIWIPGLDQRIKLDTFSAIFFEALVKDDTTIDTAELFNRIALN